MAMTGQPLGVTDAVADRSKKSLADRTPSESQSHTVEKQQTDERNRKTMERQFEAGVKLDDTRTLEPTEKSTGGIDGPYSPRNAIAPGPNRIENVIHMRLLNVFIDRAAGCHCARPWNLSSEIDPQCP
jgi:hypothetical protein